MKTPEHPSVVSLSDLRARLARQGAGDIRLGLERMRAALAALGAPERRGPPVIHVAGTNGKGSVIAFLKAMLESGGFRVHAFTSPALVRAGEQISVSGAALSEAALDALISEVTAAAPDLTPFEALAAAAFVAFARSPADVTLLETGMGGRLDATNVIERPALTVLMPIAEDHTRFLGPTLGEIAGAKVGILKASVPAVVAPQRTEALEVIEAEAARIGVALSRHGTEWLAFEERGRFVFQSEDGLMDLPLPALAGRHQIDNAGAAMAALQALGGLGLDERAIAHGLERARWPARLERLTAPERLAALPPASDLWLDGAHNVHATQALALFLADLQRRDPKPLFLVVGMREDKETRRMFETLAALTATVLTVPLTGDTSGRAPAALAEDARAAGLTAEVAESVAEALARVSALSKAPARVVLCGSLSLARLAYV